MITIKDFSFSYQRKQVLKSVNLQYESGKIYYLLGPNGFGKSTLLRCIAGLHQPEKGNIEINHHNTFERDLNVLQDLCFISEETYYPDMPIIKFASLYGTLYPRFDPELFDCYLQMFEVEKECRLSALSFGQKKKTYLAFAFATNAKIILLDEPTNGLDINSKMQFRKILASSTNNYQTIIIGTHDVSDMDVLADGITVLGQKEVVFHQNTGDILQRISFDFVTDAAEAAQALYSEQVHNGFMILNSNLTHEETNLNIELLYRGLISPQQKITALFN